MLSRDSVGNVLVANGNGYLKNIDSKWGEGRVENEYKEGLWKGTESVPDIHYEEEYKMGVLQKGTSHSDGKKYRYTSIQVDPEFRGGLLAMNRFLISNMRYPKQAAENNILGRVFVSFVVDENGKVYDVNATTKNGYGLEEEAVRVVKSMSRLWKPGKHRGHNVKVRFTLPINFALEQ